MWKDVLTSLYRVVIKLHAIESLTFDLFDERIICKFCNVWKKKFFSKRLSRPTIAWWRWWCLLSGRRISLRKTSTIGATKPKTRHETLLWAVATISTNLLMFCRVATYKTKQNEQPFSMFLFFFSCNSMRWCDMSCVIKLISPINRNIIYGKVASSVWDRYTFDLVVNALTANSALQCVFAMATLTLWLDGVLTCVTLFVQQILLAASNTVAICISFFSILLFFFFFAIKFYF